MEESRDKLIERAKLIQRAKEIQENLNDKEDSSLMDTDTIFKGLDYTRAATGGPAFAQALEKMSGKKVYDPAEYEAALKLQASYPSSADLMNRAGYLQDYPTTREILGFGADIALDPTTYASFGSSALAKALAKGGKWAGRAGTAMETALKPMSKTSEVAGKGIYKGAFQSLDTEAKNLKKLEPSDVFLAEGKNAPAAWTARGVNEQIADLSDKFYDAREAILKQGDIAGLEVSPDKAIEYGKELADKYRKKGLDKTNDIADAIEKEVADLQNLKARPEQVKILSKEKISPILDEYGKPIVTTKTSTQLIPARAGVNPSRATDIKTFFYNNIPSTKWAPYANTAVGDALSKAQALGIKEATEDTISKGLGDIKGKEFKTLNEKLGSILSTKKKELGQVTKDETRDLFTGTDAIAMAGSAAAGVDPTRYFLIKKAYDLAKLQGPRTKLGKGLYNYGASKVAGPLSDSALRRGTWSLLNNPYTKEETE